MREHYSKEGGDGGAMCIRGGVGQKGRFLSSTPESLKLYLGWGTKNCTLICKLRKETAGLWAKRVSVGKNGLVYMGRVCD